MLRLGRTDVLLLSELIGWHAIHGTFPEEHRNFATLERPYEVVPSWLMVSSSYPDSSRLLQRFDHAFRKLAETGYIDALTEQYIPER